MFAVLLRIKRKIRKLLKVQTETRQKPVSTQRSRATKILMLLVVSVSVGVLYPAEVLYDPLDMPRRGEIAQDDIVAPFEITVFKNDREMHEEQERIRLSTYYVLDAEAVVVDQLAQSLDTLLTLVDSLKSPDNLRDPVELSRCIDSLAGRFPRLSQYALQRLLAGQVNTDSLASKLKSVIREQIYRVGVIARLGDLPESSNPLFSLRKNGEETVIDRTRVLDLPMADARLLTALNQLAATDFIDSELYYLVGRSFVRPNLTVNMTEYNRRVQYGQKQLSNVKEVVTTGEVIVSARQKVTRSQEEVLQEMVRLMRSQAADQGWLMAFLPAVARVVLVLAIFTALYWFLFVFRPEVFRSNPKLLALFMVFVLQMGLVYLVEMLNLNSIYIYPIAVLPIMVTILFDAEVGVLCTVVLALLLGILHRFSFPVALLTSVVGVVACFTSRRVRKRSNFYRIMLFVMISYMILIITVENLKLSPNAEVLTEIIYGLAIAMLSVLVVTGILPVFESLFGITTDTTLLELSDLNHPMLKRLAIEAPGTYHHSISVGNLSESAAKAIGANSLLARVGAYYHDIGKIEIPEYFVENQFSVKSKHEMLAPAMSALILVSHVKKGRLLGEEADIPDDVLNFIEEHHGTMVMSYFYNKAVEQEAQDISVEKFQYPGPKPQTRETGITMLADAVEAASRTLDEPKPARIDTLIQRIINDRFQSGELDECPLTLRDLARIKQAFSQVLIAAFHHRVKYPAQLDVEVP